MYSLMDKYVSSPETIKLFNTSTYQEGKPQTDLTIEQLLEAIKMIRECNGD